MNAVMSARDRILARRADIAAQRAKGVRLYKWKSGKTIFRILPDKNGGDFERRYGKMWLKSFDGQQKLSIGDRYITYGQDDPIRDAVFRAMSMAPTNEIRDHYKEMLASTRHVFQVLILSVNGQPDPDAAPDTPVLVDVSASQMDNIYQQFEVYLDIDPTHDLSDPQRGHVFTCNKVGTGYDTTYTFLATPQAMPIKPEVLEKLHDLDGWVEAEFEGMESKALEFLSRLNSAAGINDTFLPAFASPALAGNPQHQAALPGTTTGVGMTNTGVSQTAVTTVIDAEYTVPSDDTTPPFETTQTQPAATPSAPAAQEAATTSSDVDEIADILAALG